MDVMVNIGGYTSDKLFEALEIAISYDAIGHWGYIKLSSYDDTFKRIREGKPIDVFDIEDNEKLATMTKESIRKGFELMINEFPHEFANLMTYIDDTEDTDILFQLCCFEEVMFNQIDE